MEIKRSCRRFLVSSFCPSACPFFFAKMEIGWFSFDVVTEPAALGDAILNWELLRERSKISIPGRFDYISPYR